MENISLLTFVFKKNLKQQAQECIGNHQRVFLFSFDCDDTNNTLRGAGLRIQTGNVKNFLANLIILKSFNIAVAQYCVTTLSHEGLK